MTRIRFQDLPSQDTPVDATNLNKLNNVVISSTEPNTGEEVWIQKGENLFDKNNVTNGYRLSSAGVLYAETGYSASSFIPVLSNTSYIVSWEIGTYANVCYYDKDGTLISRNINTNPFTTPSNCKYIRVSLLTTNLDTAQIRKGSTLPSYEPYISNNVYLKDNNNDYVNFLNIDSLQKSSDVTSIQIGSSTGSTISVKSSGFETMTGITRTFNATKEKSTILVFVSIGGLYNTNSGYGIAFDVKMDGTTTSTSGAKSTNNGDWRNNWSTDGSSKIVFTNMFVFTNVPKGSHDFNIVWSSNNNDVTAYTGNYSNRSMTIVEL